MKKYKVRIAIDMPQFRDIPVKATSQANAEKIVSNSFKKLDLESDYFDLQNGDWDQAWHLGGNLRVIKKSSKMWEHFV